MCIMSETGKSESKSPAASSRRNFVKSVAAGSALAAGLPSLLSGEETTTADVSKNKPTEKTASATAASGKEARTVRRTLSRDPIPATRIAPSDRIGLAVIGAGGMGMADVSTALRIPGVELVAACDVFDGRLDAARERYGAGLFTTRDYNEVLAREDIDAVIVGTPDHWHQPISIAALRAGKGVYCEKPMVHTISEGHDLVRAQEESGSVFQVGSQGMSSAGQREGQGAVRVRRDRRAQLRRGLLGTQRSDRGVAIPHSSGRIPRRRSTGSASWVRHPTAPTIRSGSSAGATTATTEPGSRATSSSTSSRASTSS